MKEIWKPIAEFNGVFEISNLGAIRRFKGGRYHILTPTKSTGGYLRVCLCLNNKNYVRAVHRLVALTFIEKGAYANVVNHKDGNKLNNALENLELVTQKENHLHALSLKRTQRCNHPRGAYQRKYIKNDGSIKKVWYAQIVFKNKKKKLGVFKNKLEAQGAFKQAFERLYGFTPWEDR